MTGHPVAAQTRRHTGNKGTRHPHPRPGRPGHRWHQAIFTAVPDTATIIMPLVSPMTS